MMNWQNVYQNVNQAQAMNNMLLMQMLNNMNQMNQPMQNMNFMQNYNPMAQIQMTSNFIQNNSPNIMGGNPNFNNNMNMNMMNQNNNISKINLCFSTMKGARILMGFNPDETVSGALIKFLKRCNLDYLIGNLNNELTFLFSGQSLKFDNKKKLKNLVLFPNSITNILVLDTNNLIGAHY